MWWNPWPSTTALDVAAATRAPPQTLERLRAQRLTATLQHAAQASPLYRRIVGPRHAKDMALADWPVMRKAQLMGAFDEWVTDARLHLAALQRFIRDPARIGQSCLGDYLVWESSGSAGEPGIFVQDTASLAVYDALEAMRRPLLQPLRRWTDPWYARERIAFVGATDGHFATTVSVQRLRRVNPWMAAGLHSVSFLQPVASLVAQLNELAPTMLATYPTAALMLAEEAAAGRLRLTLHEVWTGGEAMTPAMRSFITDSLGCPVAQSYGASEFLAMGSECRRGALHLNSDWVILESVDEHHRPVPDGEVGRTTLLTNLANRVQPLIRYDLGDCVRLHAKHCACGSSLPVIDVQGRVDDSVVLNDAAGRAVRLLPLALTTVMEDEAGVYDFQILQQGHDALLLHVAAHGDDGSKQLERAQRALCHYLRAQGLAGVSVRGQSGKPGACGRSGKVQRVVAQAET